MHGRIQCLELSHNRESIIGTARPRRCSIESKFLQSGADMRQSQHGGACDDAIRERTDSHLTELAGAETPIIGCDGGTGGAIVMRIDVACQNSLLWF